METMIQIIILICLIVIIILLSVDKVKFILPVKQQSSKEKSASLPDIVGKPIAKKKRDSEGGLISGEKLASQSVGTAIPKDYSNEAIESHRQVIDNDQNEDFDDEDELPPDDDRFDQGVTLGDLTKVGDLLKLENLDQIQQSEAVQIIQKMQGTDLFVSLQSSIEGATKKIAKLLDKSVPANTDLKQQSPRTDNIDNFDISDFV